MIAVESIKLFPTAIGVNQRFLELLEDSASYPRNTGNIEFISRKTETELYFP